MSASDIALLIGVPVVWLIGYFQYTPETRAWAVTRFWLRLTFVMVVVAMGATVIKPLFSDSENDRADKILTLVAVVALLPIAFWFIVATVRSWSK
jgi:hypothetical protein